MNSPQKDSFVPLQIGAASTRERMDFKVTVVKQGSNLHALQPVGRPAATKVPTVAAAPCEPKVTLQREGDRISGIQIECSCGQVMELVCSYPAA